MTKALPSTPNIPVSWGELIDKITILEIKSEKMTGAARVNVQKELAALSKVAEPAMNMISAHKQRLKQINTQLWQIEDQLRQKEAAGEFDGRFIELARSVYRENGARMELKRRINSELHSEFVEEKQYGMEDPLRSKP